jgi:hypothetical protein
MPTREIRLESAAFLDSVQAQALGVDREDVRSIVDRFLGCCFDELGKAPRFLDGEDVHTLVGHLLPAHFARGEPLAAKMLPVLQAYFTFLEQSAVTSQIFEMRRALDSTAGEFQEAVESGSLVQHAPRTKSKPFVHGAPKVGRNERCPCGSGKKFKQCCGKPG